VGSHQIRVISGIGSTRGYNGCVYRIDDVLVCNVIKGCCRLVFIGTYQGVEGGAISEQRQYSCSECFDGTAVTGDGMM